MLGKPDAEAILTKVAASADRANTAAELARAARALRALDRPQEANDVYRDAVAEAPSDPVINTAWGELFLEKHQPADAVKSFQPALQTDPKYVPALLGFAEALADDNPPQAVVLAKQALEINPELGRRACLPRAAGRRRRATKRTPARRCTRRSP